MSHKNIDSQGRHRSKTIAFRVSPDEEQIINALVAASGLTKQDYLAMKAENHEIVVNPDIRIYKLLKEQMKDVYVELRRLRSASEMDERLIELLQILTRVFADMGEEELRYSHDSIEQVDAAVFRISRR